MSGGIFTGNVLGSRGLGATITLPEVNIVGDQPSANEMIFTGDKSAIPCNSKFAIETVQAEIGTTVDGVWGPKSEAALKKSGKTFQQLAVGCKPPVPSYSATTYQPAKTAVTATTKEAAVDPNKIAAEKQAGFSDIFTKVPTIAWIGIAGIAGLLLLKASQKKGEQ